VRRAWFAHLRWRTPQLDRCASCTSARWAARQPCKAPRIIVSPQLPGHATEDRRVGFAKFSTQHSLQANRARNGVQ